MDTMNSLSAMLLRSRTSEAIKKVAIVNAFTHEGKASLPVKLLAKQPDGSETDTEITLKGTESLPTTLLNISILLHWDSVEIAATPPQSNLLSGGTQGAIVPIKSTAMLQLLVETTLAREEVRRLDVLEASLESIRSMLLCQRTELHLRGARTHGPSRGACARVAAAARRRAPPPPPLHSLRSHGAVAAARRTVRRRSRRATAVAPC
jgi:hypothetical protein